MLVEIAHGLNSDVVHAHGKDHHRLRDALADLARPPVMCPVTWHNGGYLMYC
jgi:hypothetical protein